MAKRHTIARINADKGLYGKQLRAKSNYEQGVVKLVGIGVHKGLSLVVRDHKGLSPRACQTVAVLSRFITLSCHTCHIV